MSIPVKYLGPPTGIWPTVGFASATTATTDNIGFVDIDIDFDAPAGSNFLLLFAYDEAGIGANTLGINAYRDPFAADWRVVDESGVPALDYADGVLGIPVSVNSHGITVRIQINENLDALEDYVLRLVSGSGYVVDTLADTHVVSCSLGVVRPVLSADWTTGTCGTLSDGRPNEFFPNGHVPVDRNSFLEYGSQAGETYDLQGATNVEIRNRYFTQRLDVRGADNIVCADVWFKGPPSDKCFRSEYGTRNIKIFNVYVGYLSKISTPNDHANFGTFLWDDSFEGGLHIEDVAMMYMRGDLVQTGHFDSGVHMEHIFLGRSVYWPAGLGGDARHVDFMHRRGSQPAPHTYDDIVIKYCNMDQCREDNENGTFGAGYESRSNAFWIENDTVHQFIKNHTIEKNWATAGRTMAEFSGEVSVAGSCVWKNNQSDDVRIVKENMVWTGVGCYANTVQGDYRNQWKTSGNKSLHWPGEPLHVKNNGAGGMGVKPPLDSSTTSERDTEYNFFNNSPVWP